ncbi:MAG: SPOR domain-containing protein [Treponema sp.]|jgi:hypothetical protein|nr:SPOR domain-containing protein [Treponema sp.]
MKRFPVLVGILLALLVFTNASVWEGAAATAANEDLPQEGYYAATNSFPRDTVVDITNLENGKSIRVIVWGGLDTPGLLIILSKDASMAIGLEARTIGRVRMSQPADSIAFSRFTDGLVNSGDPDYDPKAAVASDTPYVPPPEAPVSESPRTEVPAPERPASQITAAPESPPPEAPVSESPRTEVPAPESPPSAASGIPVETPADSSSVLEEVPLPSSTIVDIPEIYEPLSPETPVLQPETEIAGVRSAGTAGPIEEGYSEPDERNSAPRPDAESLEPVPPQTQQRASISTELAESDPVPPEPVPELAAGPGPNTQEGLPEPGIELKEPVPELAAEPVPNTQEPVAEPSPVSKAPSTETKGTERTAAPEKIAEAIQKAEEPSSDLAWIDRKLNAHKIETDLEGAPPDPAREEGRVKSSSETPAPANSEPVPETARSGLSGIPSDPGPEAIQPDSSPLTPVRPVSEAPRPALARTKADPEAPSTSSPPVKPDPGAPRPRPPSSPVRPQPGNAGFQEADPDLAWETGITREPQSSGKNADGKDTGKEAVIDPSFIVEPVKTSKNSPKPAPEPAAENLQPQVGSVAARPPEPKSAPEPAAENLQPQVGPVAAKPPEPKSAPEPAAENLQPQVGPVAARPPEPKSAPEPAAEEFRPDVVEPIPAVISPEEPDKEIAFIPVMPEKVQPVSSSNEPEPEYPQSGAGERIAETEGPRKVLDGGTGQAQNTAETNAEPSEPAALESVLETLAGILGQNREERPDEKAGDKAAGESPAVKSDPIENQTAAAKKEGFSVPMIDKLEKGRYYLQLGAFSKAETVERELLKIDGVYPLSIQDNGNKENPVYRILVGPVNRGESNALLERFKTLGYRDAFVRTGS